MRFSPQIHPALSDMKILLIATLVALTAADVSHLFNQQPYLGYQYQNSVPENSPHSSYGAPQASVVGNSAQGVSVSSSGSAAVPELVLPSISGPSVSFDGGFSTPSTGGVTIQSYNGFSSPAPNAGIYQVSTPAPSVGLSSYQVSNPAPNIDLSSFQVSSPAPSVDLSGFQASTPNAGIYQVSTPAPSVGLSSFQVSNPAPNIDLSSFQVSSPAPSVDFSGFQGSTPSSIPSVNLVQYSQQSQPSSSYQFLSGLSQPSASVQSIGLTSLNGARFGSDASYNSGISVSSAGQASSGLGSNFDVNSFIGQTSGGRIDDAFGVVTTAAGGAGHAESSQESEVSKHLYFFAAPEEEEEEVQAKVELPPVPPKKTYKIIFIKAPTYRNQATITIPAPPANEEKTLVYVLVKKPEGRPTVRFQGAATTQPSKPEVFFIKYKTQKEAEEAVAEIQSKHGASGHVIANLPAAAALQSRSDVSVSSTPSSINFGGSNIGLETPQSGYRFDSSLPSGGLKGLSFDSVGANSFVSSTPSSPSLEGRISAEIPQVSQPQESVASQIGGGDAGLQINLNQDVAQSPATATFDQSSGLSQIVEDGIASSTAAPVASSTIEAETGVSSESTAVLETASQQGDASESDSDSNPIISEGAEDNQISQNAIEERIGGNSLGDNDSQGSQAAPGFASYGPPNYY